MLSLARLPIRAKLRLIVLATCTVALGLTGGTLFVLHRMAFIEDYEQSLAADAQLVAAMAAGDLAQGHSNEVRNSLATLAARPSITGAFIRLPNGARIKATYGRLDPVLLHATFVEGLQHYADDLLYIQPLVHAGQRLGTLTVISAFQEQSSAMIRRDATLFLGVVTGALLLASLLATRLEKVIADPIDHLAETARRVSARDDYSVRASKMAEDEIGEFTDTFNRMLGNIQNRDSALRYEIAERVRAEQELERAHQQFMEASRQEGMADVATCVLHNVGNVLNSVNVSATLISENLNSAHADNLVKATALLRDHSGGLDAYLHDDPKGRLLPGYLADVGDQILQERGVALSELELLRQNIDHIKEIVNMQQSYARSFGLVQTLAVTELVEDALRMNSSALERHGVLVVRDFSPVPLICVDKHKVLQILVNLIRNSRHALDDAAPSKKRLTVSVRPQAGAFIEISVDDNGIGISEAHRTKLFSHGFTTRVDGHGFGLHNGAVTAQQMGGTLQAQSGGHLRGATFTLTLPLQAPQSA